MKNKIGRLLCLFSFTLFQCSSATSTVGPNSPPSAAGRARAEQQSFADPTFLDETGPIAPPFLTLDANATAVDHLSKAPKPHFRATHTLPPLSMYGYLLARDSRIALAKDYGFGLHESLYIPEGLQQVAAAEPEKYKVTVSFNPGQHDRDENIQQVLSPAAWLRDAQGNVLTQSKYGVTIPYLSPLAPDADFIALGKLDNEKLRAISDVHPISVIVNGGENDVIDYFGGQDVLSRDPSIVAYLSENKVDARTLLAKNKIRAEKFIKQGALEGVRWAADPTYIFYTEDYGQERGRWFGWPDYIPPYEFNAEAGFPVSDLPNGQSYHDEQNSGFSGANPGSGGVPYDILTNALNGIAGNTKFGRKNSFMWISPGYGGHHTSDIERLVGFWKTLYTAGVLSVNMGEYDASPGPGAVGEKAPDTVKNAQMIGHVHALFSHLEGYLRQGDLLDDGRLHPFADTTERLPLYELKVENESVTLDPLPPYFPTQCPTARVLARKVKDEDRWLMTAWANVGEDRLVNVTVPGLGRVTLNARKAGSVYLAKLVDGQPQLKLVDEDPMNPTARLAETTVTKGSLKPGVPLRAFDSLTSLDGHMTLSMQPDGNLVLSSSAYGAVWNAGTQGNPGAYAVMQDDSNFVVYARDGTALWFSATTGDARATLSLFNDGNMAIISGDGRLLWQSNTAGK